MTERLFSIYGLMCFVSVLASCFALPEERKAAFRCGLAFGAGWLWYISAWAEHSPAMTIWGVTGYPIQPSALWALGDCLVGAYIAEKASDRTWGLALVCLFIGQCACHVLSELIAPTVYLATLDATFAVQVAVFIFIGGNGLGTWVSDYLDRRRHAVDQAQAARRLEGEAQ